MKLQKLLLGAAALFLPFAAAQEAVDITDADDHETFNYRSDIARLRSLVINSLYSHKDVFLRELLSNANDALEKLRLESLTNRGILSGGEPNITISIESEDGKTGRLIVRDTGIGMNRTELAKNLGTIARSGTNEFLANAERTGHADTNFIGQFGLGFYSSFLVSPTVQVSSIPPVSEKDPEPVQYTFVSSSTGDRFEVFRDPRGNTLGRGTEIILNISEEDKEFLSPTTLKALIDKHSAFSTTFPIYVREAKAKAKDEDEDGDNDDDDDDKWDYSWTHVNNQPPIWMREPSQVPKEDYVEFYRAVSKDAKAEPLGWSHFKGDTASGIAYRAIMYIPETLPKDFWTNMRSGVNNVRLYVKRVFITDELGKEYMPRWLSFLKVTVDADDLPLNVNRETLQNHRFLKQLQRILIRKALDLFTRIAETEPERYQSMSKMFGNALRIGMLESQKDKVKIAKLLRFESTTTNYTSLEEYVERRKEGQKQIYYLCGTGETTSDLARSPFVEKLKARGYEVLLLNLPSDEPMMGALDMFMGMRTQDVAKKGLIYGDEEADEVERRELAASEIAYRPLLEWFKKEFAPRVADVVLTNRLVTSPCTIVVDNAGWSANMARIMAAQADAADDPMYNVLRNLPRVLEINPKSPLMEGFLSRVIELPEAEDGESAEELEMRELAQVLFDTALVRSGFDVADTVSYFERVEALLRREIGVSLSAKADETVRPAPPTADAPLEESESEKTSDEDKDGDEEDIFAQFYSEEDKATWASEANGPGDGEWVDFQDWKKTRDEL
ncbi:hypothetical protein CspeluHIS016_0202360 [Cutaneotrichosporon spelunceum]|uniref:Cation-transporting ATPase n=1 Tax=Cutaneotrichosporon spelunceum TaxID=1672016 RepID=A0AAD3TRQ4_9TREE|nr:hypothetical protein CspeluHIS016_0202360 [Cutaneotrichosporon spelunceum]